MVKSLFLLTEEALYRPPPRRTALNNSAQKRGLTLIGLLLDTVGQSVAVNVGAEPSRKQVPGGWVP